MRLLLLTNRQPNQVALANKLADVADVAGVVLSANVPRRKPNIRKRAKLSINRIASRTVGREFIESWFSLQSRYEAVYRQLPSADVTMVANINDLQTVEAIKRVEPDLVVVSGTNLVGPSVIAAAGHGRGIVNLHTGISPYVRGGPNCTNWCLSKNWFHLIGNTVMWLDLGIDTGNIIATEQTPLTGRESLSDLHWAVMEHAHGLYVESIRRLGAGIPLPSVPQSSIGAGAYFESVDWNATTMRAALRNFRRNYAAHFARDNGSTNSGIRLFPLGDV